MINQLNATPTRSRLSIQSYFFGCLCILVSLWFNPALSAKRISTDSKDKLAQELPVFGLTLGDEVFVRVFKKEAQLELWMRPSDQNQFRLFRTYPICHFSGGLGPKLKTGDHVAPEGFYAITANDLNPYSQFHLSMDIGFPNAYDRYHGRTGSLLMIHGACDSEGCFAMGNQQIEEIYHLVQSALNQGQKSVNVHAFPFRLSLENLEKYKTHRWYGFWTQLKSGYDEFNQTQIPPNITVADGKYVVSPSNESTQLVSQ